MIKINKIEENGAFLEDFSQVIGLLTLPLTPGYPLNVQKNEEDKTILFTSSPITNVIKFGTRSKKVHTEDGTYFLDMCGEGSGCNRVYTSEGVTKVQRDYTKEWQKTHKKEIYECCKRWRENNPEKVREMAQNWKLKNQKS